MSSRLWEHPQVLALLSQAMETPEDDAPRLVLADWLEDHGDPDRAEFVRAQLRLAPGVTLPDTERESLRRRSNRLLTRHGGGWIGPLWTHGPSPLSWHRGLLSAGLPQRADPAELPGTLSWIDTLTWRLCGSDSVDRLATLLGACGPNHLCLDVGRPVREDRLLGWVARMPASPCLRSLSIRWPLGLLRPGAGCGVHKVSPTVSGDFLAELVDRTPLTRRLTHLASSPGWEEGQAEIIRSLGVEPVCPELPLWMHTRSPACFRTSRDGF